MRYGPTTSAAKPKAPRLPTLGKNLTIDPRREANPRGAIEFDQSGAAQYATLAAHADTELGGDACASLNGSTQYFTIANANAGGLNVGNESFTVEAWVKPDSVSGGARNIVTLYDTAGNQRNYMIRQLDADIQWYQSSDGSTFSYVNLTGSPFTAGQWLHLVCLYDATAGLMVIQADNAQTNNVDHAGGGNSSSTANFSIGGRSNSGVDRFNGEMGPVRFWRRKLTAGEITYLYNNHNGRTAAEVLAAGIVDTAAGVDLTENLEAAWDLDDLTDDSGNGNTLTNNGAVPFTGLGITGHRGFSILARAKVADASALAYFLGQSGSSGTRCWFLKNTATTGKPAITTYSDGINPAASATSSAALSSGAFAEIAAGYNPTTNKQWIEVNGTRAEVSQTSGVWAANRPLLLASLTATAGQSDATFEVVRYFNEALTEEEVAAEFASPNPVKTSALVFDLDLDRHNANTLDDRSANGHDFTTTGSPTVVDGQTAHAADDGDPVFEAGDGSQTNPAARPLFDATTKALDFDGGDDLLETSKTPGLTNTLYVVGSIANNSTLLVGCYAGSGRFFLGRYSDKWAAGIAAQSWTIIQGTTNPTARAVVCLRNDGTNVALFVNGVKEYESAQSGTPPTTVPIYAGAQNNNGTPANHAEATLDAVHHYKNIVHTDAQVAAVMAALAADHGV